MQTIRNYLSLIKFSHTIFAMPFALIGFFLGVQHGPPERYLNLNHSIGWGWDPGTGMWWQAYLRIFILVILCMVMARSAAMAFNRYLDKNFDALNPRTAIREIPAGIVSANSALWFTIVCSLLFMLFAFFLNPLCFYLSPVALAVILGYSYTKRFTPLCHLILGLGLSLAPIGAYLAVTAQFALVPVLFSIAVLLWVSGFDIIYSLQDEEFDKANNLHSIPAAVGKEKALKISEALHTACALVLLGVYVYSDFGWLYISGWIIFITMLTYQHAIVKPHDLSRVNLAFMTANGIASIVFATFVISDLVFLK
ncbi:MAG TPA: UbiA-like polyprenyltransferase [Chitinophagaceae bacterium]